MGMSVLADNFSTSKAKQVQLNLISRVVDTDEFVNPPRTVGGFDVAYYNQTAIGAAVLLTFPQMRLLKQRLVYCRSPVPYIPTLLSFREFAPLSLAYSALQHKPDLCFVDAHGRAHPRRLGAASHFGVLRNAPTIGVAKKRLCGEIQSNGTLFKKLILDGEQIGAQVLSKVGCKPIYVSIGHRISLETAINLTQKCITKYRLPEPIRQAHRLATLARQKIKATG